MCTSCVPTWRAGPQYHKYDKRCAQGRIKRHDWGVASAHSGESHRAWLVFSAQGIAHKRCAEQCLYLQPTTQPNTGSPQSPFCWEPPPPPQRHKE